MQYTGRISFTDMGEKALINALINTNIVPIYWYFIPQFAIYLLIPFISAISEEKRESAFRYIIIVMLLFNVAFPLLFQLIGLTYNGALYVPLSGYSLYIFIGYYIDCYEISSANRKLLYILGIIGLLIHIVGTWELSYSAGEIIQTYKGYLNLPCVMYSIAIYTFFKYHNGNTWMEYLYRWSKPIAETTLGIYLIHWYLMDWFSRHVPDISPLSLDNMK